ncbi:MAG: hypothetical protein R8M45_04735 [Ghiorsea sp.]
MEVADQDLNDFHAFLDDVGYTYMDESNNTTLKLFL